MERLLCTCCGNVIDVYLHYLEAPRKGYIFSIFAREDSLVVSCSYIIYSVLKWTSCDYYRLEINFLHLYHKCSVLRSLHS